MGESFPRSFMRAVSPREERAGEVLELSQWDESNPYEGWFCMGSFNGKQWHRRQSQECKKKEVLKQKMIIQWAKDCLVPLGGFRDGRGSSQSYHGISCHRGRWEPIGSSRILSVKGTIDRYKKACTDNSSTGSISEANSQYYQQEATKLRQQITNLQNSNRNLLGDALTTMSLRDLKQLETRLEKGINKIRSKKNELLHAEIDYMQKREMELQTDNMYLRNKIADNERVQQHQHMSILPSTSTDYEVMTPFDSRSFLQVNLLDPNDHYSHQQQTALQLG